MVINGRQFRRMAMLGTAVILAPLLSPAQPAAAEPRLTLDNPTFTNAAAFDRTAPLRDVVRARAASRASGIREYLRRDVGSGPGDPGATWSGLGPGADVGREVLAGEG